MRSQIKWQLLTGAMCGLTLAGIALPSWADTVEGLNFITQLSGDVKVKRPNWNNFQNARRNQPLSSKDLLQLGTQSSAIVLCGDLSRWKVPAGKISRVSDPEACPMGVPTLVPPDSRRTTTRGGNPTIPYIISPRKTSILDPLPLIRWHHVVGAKHYTVEVRRGEKIHWTFIVNQSEVKYAGEALKPGYYQVFVTADTGASSRSEEPVGFTLLKNEEAQRIKADAERLQQQLLDEEAQTIALAYLYWGNKLHALAIERLEELVRKGNQTASVYQLLGEIYQKVGLNELALEKYKAAIEKVGDNLEGQASIQASLGEIYNALIRKDEARHAYQQAQDDYRALGDEQRVMELQKKLDELAKK